MIEGLLYTSFSFAESLTWKLNLCPVDLIFRFSDVLDSGMNAPSGNSMNRCGCGLRDGGIRVRFAETRGLNLVLKFRLIKIRSEEFCTVGRFIISPGIGMTESMRVRWIGNVGEMRSPYIWYWLVYLKGTDVSEDTGVN
jgi:hypothetical protein